MKRGRHVNRFFIRLLLSFLFLTALLLGFFALWQGWQEVERRQRHIDRLSSNFHMTASSIESQITSVQNLGVTFLTEPDVVLYLRPAEEMDLEASSHQGRFPEILRSQESIMPDVVDSLFVFLPGDHKVWTSAGTYDRSFFFEEMMRYRDYDEDFWQQNFQSGGMRLVLPMTQAVGHDGKEKDILPVVTTARVSGNIVVHVSNLEADAIKKLFIDATLSGQAQFILYTSDGTVVYDSDPSNDAVSFYTASNKETVGPWMVFRSQGSSSGWSYLTLVPESEFSDGGHRIVLFLIFGFVCFLGIFLALLLALRIYRPIGRVSRMLPEEEGGSGDAIARLSQGIGRLLSDQKDAFVRHSLHLLLLGFPADDLDELKRTMAERYHIVDQTLVCVLFLFDFRPGFYQRYGKEQRRSFIASLPKLLEDHLQGFPSMVFDLHGGMVASISACPRARRQNLFDRLSASKELFGHDQEIYALHVGLGGGVDDIERIGVSYNQALAAIRSGGKGEVFSLRDFVTMQKQHKVSFDFYDQKALLSALAGGSGMLVDRLLDGIFSRNDPSDLSADNLKELYQQLLLVGRRALEDAGVEAPDSMQALEQWLKKPEGDGRPLVRTFYQEVVALAGVRNQDASREQALARGAMRYIESHYQEPLSLEIIASELGVTGKYLSRLFKEQTGQNLSQVVVKIRMEKAKTLIRDGKLKVGEIGDEVGIDSRATFLRLFKKTIGVSPSAYRALVGGETDAKEES